MVRASFLVIVSLTGFVLADDAKPQAEEKWLIDRTLTLSPQPEPRPALEYRLFPLASDRKDGNAVPIYLRSTLNKLTRPGKIGGRRRQSGTRLPIDKIPLKEANAFLSRYKNFLRQFELGARRKTADWNTRWTREA